MATNARTLYLDDETYDHLGLLARLKRASRSSIIRSMINEKAHQMTLRQSPPEKSSSHETGSKGTATGR